MNESRSHSGNISTSPAQEHSNNRMRYIISVILLIIGLLSLMVGVPVLWLQRTILTTDGWVAAVGPLAEQPAVQDAVANGATQKFTSQVDIEGWVREQLPPQSVKLAAPIAALIETSIRRFTDLIVSSSAFAALWEQVNRTSHNLIMAGLSGVQKIQGIKPDDLTLDLGPVMQKLQAELQKKGFTFTLPDKFNSTVTVLRSDQLASLVKYVEALQTAALWLTIVAFVAFAGSIVVHFDRRGAVLALGVGVFIAGLLLMVGVSVMRWQVVGSVSPGAIFTPEAMQEVYNTVIGGLVASLRATVLAGLILWLGAVALGPSRSMVSARQYLREGIHGMGKNRAPAGSELWIGAHKQAIQIWVLIAAGIALIIPAQRSVSYIIILTVIVVLVEFFVEFFGRMSPPMARAH